MTVRELISDDLQADVDWLVTQLDVRRAALRPHAPVFWRPAPDAAAVHGAYLRGLLESGAARAWRTDESVLVAATGPRGVLVDDAHVAGERWDTEGAELWAALVAAHAGERVRFVCPAYEPERNAFAAARLDLAETWWLVERDDAAPLDEETEVTVPGAESRLLPAPPVYAPGGPMLYLPRVDDAAVALPAALATAAQVRCAGVVVDQRPDQQDLAGPLERAGLRRQCHFYEGTL